MPSELFDESWHIHSSSRKYSSSFYKLGGCLIFQNQVFIRAERSSDESLEKYTKQPSSFYKLGGCFLFQDQVFVQAERSSDESLEKFTKHPSIFSNLGAT